MKIEDLIKFIQIEQEKAKKKFGGGSELTCCIFSDGSAVFEVQNNFKSLEHLLIDDFPHLLEIMEMGIYD